MRQALALALLLCLATTANAAVHRTGGPATTDNDASCDISILPAATLLLPYFEVDITSPTNTGETTLITLTNTTELPQVAHVTLWTDWGYPVIDFNIFLTGYDVQSINLFDVIRRGRIAPDDGTGFDVSPVGELSGDDVNRIPFDNPALDETRCVDLPVQLPAVLITRMQSAFTTGKVPQAGTSPRCNTAGSVHSNARGYATIDVVGACAAVLPTDSAYFTDLIRYDNVLTGDYLQVNGNEDFAQGGPLVHLRATPEGGTPQTRVGNSGYQVNSPRTFYSRYLPNGAVSDARQPLPATFHARWISGGQGGFQTFYKIWREGASTAATACSALPAANGAIELVELVRFDEEENPEAFGASPVIPPFDNGPFLASSSLTGIEDDSVFPPNSFDAVAGWLYLNLDSSSSDAFATQNWVVTSMRANDRFSVDIDALALGNGCSAPTRETNAINGTEPIGPAPNIRPQCSQIIDERWDNSIMRHRPLLSLCAVLLLAVPLSAATFPAATPTSTNNDDTCDIALLPAATLLVPYFEVDLAGAGAQTTILTITNTSHLPQAFAMTLWTDYGYPVITFRYYLTGYDVQSINLFDVIRRGRSGGSDTGTGSDVSPVGRLSGTSPTEDFDNPRLDEASCTRLPVQLPQVYITRMVDAFTRGRVATVGSVPGCDNIGGTHTNAVGYATIDVIGACASTLPTDTSYFSAEIAYENVLMGDYLQVDGLNDFAQGSPMVHIRAIPEGGTPSTRGNTNFSRTFYSHLQPAARRTLDGRQPLPATFAARWIDGGGGDFETHYKVWRGVNTPAGAACAAYTANARINFAEIVRFDEEENPETTYTESLADPPMGPATWLPATSLVDIDSEHLPVNSNGAVSGWMYFNLNDNSADEANQNWLVASMRAEGRFSVDMDAVALGNGCSAVTPVTNANRENGQPIGPAPNTTP